MPQHASVEGSKTCQPPLDPLGAIADGPTIHAQPSSGNIWFIGGVSPFAWGDGAGSPGEWDVLSSGVLSMAQADVTITAG